MARRVLAKTDLIDVPSKAEPPKLLVKGDIYIAVNTYSVSLVRRFDCLRSDAELVQFYLSEFFENTKPLPEHQSIKFPIKIDGDCGPNTDQAIRVYQQYHLSHPTPDGKVTEPTLSGAGIPHESGGPLELADVSYKTARTILALARFWETMNPGADILASPKLQHATHLPRVLIPYPKSRDDIPVLSF